MDGNKGWKLAIKIHVEYRYSMHVYTINVSLTLLTGIEAHEKSNQM